MTAEVNMVPFGVVGRPLSNRLASFLEVLKDGKNAVTSLCLPVL